jgi:hypothetical protein
LNLDRHFHNGSGQAGEVLDDFFGQRIDVATDSGGVNLHVSEEVVGLLGWRWRRQRCSTAEL